MPVALSIRACGSGLAKTVQRRSLRTIAKSPKQAAVPSVNIHAPSVIRQRAKTTSANRSSSAKSSRIHSGQRRKASLTSDTTSSAASRAVPAATNEAQRNLTKELIDVLSDILGKPRTLPIPRWVTPKYYTITYSECFGHASFILVAISYAVDDFLWLRIIAVAGSTSMLVFTYFHPHGKVLWLPFKWNVLFIAINSYRIGKIFLDRYMAEQLTDELRCTRSRHFYLMDPVDFSRLTRTGTVEVYKKGDVVVEQGDDNPYVRFVLSGGLKVLRDGKLTYKLAEGNFVSENGLHAGLMLPGSVNSCCRVVANGDVRILAWDRTELLDLLNRSESLKRSLKTVLSWDIVRKLKAQRLMLSDGFIRDPEAWTRRRQAQTEHRYLSILRNLLAANPENFEQRKQELMKYRTIHHIDDEYHRQALKECGWTVEEFEAGYKPNYETNNVYKRPRHGMDWYIREAITRIVG